MTDNSKKYCTFAAELLKVAFFANFYFMRLRHFQKVISKIAVLAVMRVCIIGIIGSRRPHRVDDASPRFCFKKYKKQ